MATCRAIVPGDDARVPVRRDLRAAATAPQEHPMNEKSAPAQRAPAPQRLAAAIAAVIISASVLAALLLAFHGSSPQVWLAPTPEVMEMVANCDRLADRRTRERCVQQRVAARLAQEPGATRMARQGRDDGAAPDVAASRTLQQ
jgi:hypothetical protein